MFENVASKLYSGGTPSTKDITLWNGDIEWITSKWLKDQLYLSNGEKKISVKGLKKSASKVVPAENIIIATRVGVGKVCIKNIASVIN